MSRSNTLTGDFIPRNAHVSSRRTSKKRHNFVTRRFIQRQGKLVLQYFRIQKQSEYYDHQGNVVDSVSPVSEMAKRHNFVTKHSIQRPGKLVLQSVLAKPTDWVKHPKFSEYHSESFSVTEKEKVRYQPLHFPESDTRSLIKTQRRDVLATPTAWVKNPEISEYHSEKFTVTEKEGLRHQPSHLPCPSHLALPSLSRHKNERQQKVKGWRHQPSRLHEPGTSHLASPSLSCHPNERQQKVKFSPKSQKIDTLPYHEPDAVDDKTAGDKRQLDSLKSKPSICKKKLSKQIKKLKAVARKFLPSRAMKAFRAQSEVRANAVNHPTAELHQIKQHALGPPTDALPTEPSTSITLSSLHDPLSADNVRKRRECPTQCSIRGERVCTFSDDTIMCDLETVNHSEAFLEGTTRCPLSNNLKSKCTSSNDTVWCDLESVNPSEVFLEGATRCRQSNHKLILNAPGLDKHFVFSVSKLPIIIGILIILLVFCLTKVMLLLEKRGVDPPFGRFSDNFASDCWNHCVLPSEAQHGKVSPCATENSKFDFGLCKTHSQSNCPHTKANEQTQRLRPQLCQSSTSGYETRGDEFMDPNQDKVLKRVQPLYLTNHSDSAGSEVGQGKPGFDILFVAQQKIPFDFDFFLSYQEGVSLRINLISDISRFLVAGSACQSGQPRQIMTGDCMIHCAVEPSKSHDHDIRGLWSVNATVASGSHPSDIPHRERVTLPNTEPVPGGEQEQVTFVRPLDQCTGALLMNGTPGILPQSVEGVRCQGMPEVLGEIVPVSEISEKKFENSDKTLSSSERYHLWPDIDGVLTTFANHGRGWKLGLDLSNAHTATSALSTENMTPVGLRHWHPPLHLNGESKPVAQGLPPAPPWVIHIPLPLSGKSEPATQALLTSIPWVIHIPLPLSEESEPANQSLLTLLSWVIKLTLPLNRESEPSAQDLPPALPWVIKIPSPLNMESEPGAQGLLSAPSLWCLTPEGSPLVKSLCNCSKNKYRRELVNAFRLTIPQTRLQ